ncbi:alpha/beta-hydrolase [Piedraia hortae CBS 480.64]|uniref:Carboxylic ester hydrolase n=1 Tax=Piedraia hortae CBS 480.64 TaxID=1314780 RepID=A0A6A7CA88_9PEZI|nr:alpha/beta-hydrolase [Piedraia hortae CBS 480.64]
MLLSALLFALPFVSGLPLIPEPSEGWRLAGNATLLERDSNQNVVVLDYASYRGTADGNGVSQWLGMRFATPPTGSRRFKAPQPPDKQSSVQDASKFGSICLPTPGDGTNFQQQSEDCLFINVFAPTGAGSSGKKLPVYFFIQGGGFATNSNANYNGAGLINASGGNIVVVNFNYRVGPWGFLASKEVVSQGNLNAGLLDQRMALQWVQKYIHAFGGDPNHVTLGGDSAGAQSVDLHLTAYGGRNDGLFHAAAAESQSFPGLRSVAESQYNYDALASRAGCSGDTFSCLQKLGADKLQSVNTLIPFPGSAGWAPLHVYGPTFDNDFIRDYTHIAFAKGSFVHVPMIGGDDTDEGSIFAPRSTNTEQDAKNFIKDQWPHISDNDLNTWATMYTPTNFPNVVGGVGSWYRALSTGYGEMRYTCGGLNVTHQLSNWGLPSWSYRWNVEDPSSMSSGFGVPHTIEVHAIWGPENTNGGAPQSYYSGGVNNPIVAVTQAYWTSFIRTYDPNTYRANGAPMWNAWTPQNENQRMKFQHDVTGMEKVPDAQVQRCRWWSGLAVKLEQ